jgi:hypothetical protein
MQKLFRCAVVMVVLGGVSGTPLASAGELNVRIGNGLVTIIAQDVPLRQILAEWSRVGKTTIVNGDKLVGPPLTLQLVDRPEREVLDLLLRSASGYIAAQRQVDVAGASVFDRVMILPTSRGPVGVASAPAPATFTSRQPMSQPMPVPADDDPIEPGVLMNQPALNQPGSPTFQNVPAQTAPGQTPQQQPVLLPRPGQLPPPQPAQPNPYGPPLPPGVRPPGSPGGGPANNPGGTL